MVRLSIHTDRVRILVDQSLVPLFLAERSTARLCKALNRSLAESGETGTIHPNRIHALLSDDVSRGVNEATLNLVEQAAKALQAVDGEWKDRSDQHFKQLMDEVNFLREDRGLDNQGIKKRLGIPPAITRHLFGEGAARSLSVFLNQGAPPSQKPSAPDWSFQDVAIANTLEALRLRPTSKIGLILPTGAGKTRTALRIVLEQLVRTPSTDALVYWVTHRKNLRTQAHRELQKLLATDKGEIPENAASLLGSRIKFVMVSELPRVLGDDATPPVIIVVDEAHHAAAPSYQPIFEAAYPVPALFLTATPNRMDLQPIGIDEISFTITYRELEERGVIVMPEFRDFPVNDFEWSENQIRDLANCVIEESAGEFTKVLVLAPRIDRVKEFYDALIDELALHPDHPLDPEDIGFIHGTGNSLHVSTDDFVDLFAEKPRAILISAQILLEGFDDPAINTVVLTYPSKSVVRLMQAAGRCVRYFHEKSAAYVVQACNKDLAYHFDQRWLYQEISDHLRPELTDIDYASEVDLSKKVAALLQKHNVKASMDAHIRKQLASITPGETCRLLLYGFPYYGAAERFDELAPWGCFLETTDNSAAFRDVFNSFCALGAHLSDPSEFLAREGSRRGIAKDLSPGSLWSSMMEILTSSYLAREEIYGSNPMANVSRPSKGRQGPTTWLHYVTFNFRPHLAPELSDFLADCYNRPSVTAAYLDDTARYGLAIKIPLPLTGHEAWLLTHDEAAAFEVGVRTLVGELQQREPGEQVGALASYLASADHRGLPARIFLRIEAFLGDERFEARVLRLPSYQSNQHKGDEQ